MVALLNAHASPASVPDKIAQSRAVGNVHIRVCSHLKTEQKLEIEAPHVVSRRGSFTT
jgi:hypothetical protein